MLNLNVLIKHGYIQDSFGFDIHWFIPSNMIATIRTASRAR